MCVGVASGWPAVVDPGGPVEAMPYLHKQTALKQLAIVQMDQMCGRKYGTSYRRF